MAQLSAYSKDLYELVAALDDRGVLRPGEREAWEEGIDDADEISELRTIEEALHKAMLDREGCQRGRQQAHSRADAGVCLTVNASTSRLSSTDGLSV